ncbi:MAG: histidine ammonia-lyase [Bacillota bacterium]|nr:histidine ammonia-lyase [Bacillota bacterium]
MEKVILTGDSLTLDQVIAVARDYAQVEIDEKAMERVEASRKVVEDIVDSERVVYGCNTGFGSLARVSISREDTAQLQENLIRSHAVGYGDPLADDEVRATILIRVNSLIKGVSAIRRETVETLLAMLNKNVIPYIPEKGSIGASGDLCPLSHMVLPMLGLGYAFYEDELLDGKDAMEKAGIPVIRLGAKEGLALNNGTTVMTAIGALATYDALQLAKVADITGALSLEAHRGIIDAFYEKLHSIRPHQGNLTTAENVRSLTDGSTLTSHTAQIRVQDAYTLRCIPQVHGASKDTINYVKSKVDIELNSATDNPIVFADGQVISGGNFHGEPMAQAFDFLCIGAAELANISERRIERLVNATLSDFPSFLVKKPGLNSGFMITQYSAAALVSENKVLAHPASVDSITSCENQEDFVSMGTIAARNARDIVSNLKRVVATELLAACQAIDFRKELNPDLVLGKGTQAAYNLVREHLPFIDDDKNFQMFDELELVTALIEDGDLLEAVEEVVALKN